MNLERIGSYWDLRAEGYSLSNMAQYESDMRNYWSETLLKYAPQRTCLKCLDIGCGPGLLGILMSQKGHIVTSIDYSEEMLAQADKNSRKIGSPIRLMKMDAQNLDFNDNSFDYIFCRDLTWNLEKPQQAYKEWLRVLAPGGKLLIADSNHYLHYYNEEYRNEYDSRTSNDHPDLLGVDPTPIDEIAKELPLSKVIRPNWDLDMLLKLGAKSVSAETKKRKYFSPIDGKEKSIIYSFLISAKKDK